MSLTFDGILPAVRRAFHDVRASVPENAVLVNRDLSGRVRLIVREVHETNSELRPLLERVAHDLHRNLGPHGVPASGALLFEPDFDAVLASSAPFPLYDDASDVLVADRLALETDWNVADVSPSTPRIVFYSVKGGVGRSTALAAAAWGLAERGERVLVVDLDLESPGLSTTILPDDRRPTFGLVDWLVEDQVGAGDLVARDMVAASGLHSDQDVLVVPAHGADPGEYIAKLGRAWVPKVESDGNRIPWATRVHRVLTELEQRHDRTVVLLDARSGLDEIAALSVVGLGAELVLAFATDAPTTWSAYGILFEHWKKLGVAHRIRDRLQVVGSLVPGEDPADYMRAVREHAWSTFLATMYDDAPPTGASGVVSEPRDLFSFDLSEDSAPHAPWPVRWSPSFASLATLHGRLAHTDATQVDAAFGRLISEIATFTGRRDTIDP